MKICRNNSDYEVPLIFTFSFPHAEYWCPYCGVNEGMLGAGEDVPFTKELGDRGKAYKKISKEYLHAQGATCCHSLIWEGKRISHGELPGKEQNRLAKIREDWKYDIKINTHESH